MCTWDIQVESYYISKLLLYTIFLDLIEIMQSEICLSPKIYILYCSTYITFLK